MSAAGLAAGVSTPAPPKLVRQRNRLDWYSQLILHGYTVVPSENLKAVTTDIQINGKNITCPDGYTILLNPNHVLLRNDSGTRS